MVPVQIAGSHQCEQRGADSLCGLVYLLALGEKGVEVDNGDTCFQAWEKRCRFAVCRKGVHIACHLLSTATKVIVLLIGQRLC